MIDLHEELTIICVATGETRTVEPGTRLFTTVLEGLSGSCTSRAESAVRRMVPYVVSQQGSDRVRIYFASYVDVATGDGEWRFGRMDNASSDNDLIYVLRDLLGFSKP